VHYLSRVSQIGGCSRIQYSDQSLVPVWWNLWVYFHNFRTEIDIDQWKQDFSARVRSLEDKDKVTNFRKTLTECENSCQGVSNLFDQADSQILFSQFSDWDWYRPVNTRLFFILRHCKSSTLLFRSWMSAVRVLICNLRMSLGNTSKLIEESRKIVEASNDNSVLSLILEIVTKIDNRMIKINYSRIQSVFYES
jgi:hypothetical protein